MRGLLWYPVCKSGFYEAALDCFPVLPPAYDCPSLAMLKHPFNYACFKTVHIGTYTYKECPAGWDDNGGLCYAKHCPAGTDAVGPVCWDNSPPEGFVDCGLGYASDSQTCADIISGQVLAVLDSAISLVSMGASKLAKSGTAPAKLADLADKFNDMMDACDKTICAIADTASLSSDTLGVLENAAAIPTDINGAGE